MSQFSPTFDLSQMETDLRIGIVVARFNEFVTTKLLESALHALSDAGVPEKKISVHWVPGAFELPFAAKRMAETGRYDAILTLGCVIRGDTTHYDYVCGEAATGVREAGMQTDVPVIFGVVTTENLDQALARTDKGRDCALSAIEMANLNKTLFVQTVPSS